MDIEQYFKVGYISKTHGLRGEVTAILESEIEFEEMNSLYLEFNGALVPYFVEKVSGKPDKPFLKFENVNSLESAAMLKGCSLYLSKLNRPKLKRGQFYDDEVFDFEVIDKNLGTLGRVKEVQHQGANRLLVIAGKVEILIPVDAPFIKSLNKSEKKIRLELPEGYLQF